MEHPARFIVTVLAPNTEAERRFWAAISTQGLARAYGDHEPKYSEADIRP